MKPSVIMNLENRAVEIMERSCEPFLNAKEASEILGCSPESLINSAEQNHLPFGFMHSQGQGFRRNLVVPKIALWNWLSKGV